jgi:hypothetical protein
MSGSSPPPRRDLSVGRAAYVAAYAVVGAALVWSRLFALGHSFWTDEIFMVEHYVRRGPREILAGADMSHELMAILAWATSSLVGESEIAMRLLSAVPFVTGVVIVTAWLHRRLGPLSGVLFLFLATVSPLLLDITRQARGYGLAFLAMAIFIVSALEARRRPGTLPVVAACAAGVMGTWTLPQFGVAFVATLGILVLEPGVRRAAAVGLVASLVAILAWYAPHLGEVRSASQIEDGVQIGFPWVLTAPIDQVLLPAFIWIDGTALVAGLVWLPLVVAALVVIAASPLARDRGAALLLGAGPVATVLVLWIAQAYVIPRYLSYLLVPLFMLLATGAASIMGRVERRGALVPSVVCVVALVFLGIRFVLLAPDIVGLPREANRDVAEVISRHEGSLPVVTYMRNPANVAFYLGRPVTTADAAGVSTRVCTSAEPVFYVQQPFALDEVQVSCLDRPGVEHNRFRQYARGGEMNVWFVPPAGS